MTLVHILHARLSADAYNTPSGVALMAAYKQMHGKGTLPGNAHPEVWYVGASPVCKQERSDLQVAPVQRLVQERPAREVGSCCHTGDTVYNMRCASATTRAELALWFAQQYVRPCDHGVRPTSTFTGCVGAVRQLSAESWCCCALHASHS